MTTALMLAACSSAPPTGSDDWTRVVGSIAPEMSSIQMLQLPATVAAGEPFTITINTVGSSSCTRSAGIDVVMRGMTAEVTPYDSVPTRVTPCTRDLRAFPRSRALTFPSAGNGLIRVHGRQGDRTIVYEATVAVGRR